MKILIITVFFLGISARLFAQTGSRTPDFVDAERAYAKQDYKTALIKLNDAEKAIKGTSANILYLKIVSREHLIESAGMSDLEPVALLKADMKHYLEKYESSDEKYRTVFELAEKYDNYRISIKQVQQAKKGELAAMVAVANAYNEVENYKAAMQWYKKAADKGDGFAAYKVGVLYDNGYGVKKDYKAAMDWYTIADSRKEPFATTSIGYLYFKGHGVKKDKALALSYINRVLPTINELAEKGDVEARLDLAVFYLEGFGVPQDLSKAFQYALQGAEAGDARAMWAVGFFYKAGYGVKKDLLKSTEWFLKSAGKGNSLAMIYLCEAYAGGVGVTKDEARGAAWMQKGAELGNTQAMAFLGALYLTGFGVPKNEEKAVEWFLKAADEGNIDALVTLGNTYRDANGVQRNYAKAREYYERAIAEADDIAALRHLGALYYAFEGYGNSIDYAKALLYYNRAAAKGDGVSMKRLSDIYASGKGVKKDKQLANEWKARAETADIKE